MRRTLLMIAAVALLLTQCRKPAVELPTAGPANENMVSMTVTVGHGGKTDINGTTGAIKWSKNDKLYVGDGSKYIGCLTLVGDGGSATGTFTGTVSATADDYTFGFYYLGSNPPAVSNGAASATVSFASQTGLRENLSTCHIGYGTASGRVKDGNVILASTDPVTMTSKVAIAYFEFKDGTAEGYTGAITLSGANICNEMTVKFSGAEDGKFTGKDKGAISLASTPSSKKYVMLVPTGTGEETLEFGGGAEGSTKFYKGIEANKFYCVGAGDPIAVAVTVPSYLPGEFTVSSGVKVKFSMGNLYAKKTGTEWEWGFYEHQYDMNSLNSQCVDGSRTATLDDAEIDLFTWGYGTWSTDPVGETYQTGSFTDWNMAPGLPDAGGGKSWRTLSYSEWRYLLNLSNASSGARTDANRFAKAKVNGVKGLLIFPDGYALPDGYTTAEGGTGMAKVNKTSSTDAPYPDAELPTDTWTVMESRGVVFLPAPGNRNGASLVRVGEDGYYWSSTSYGASSTCFLVFNGARVEVGGNVARSGHSVRLVRNAS